ncbi:glycoside hydrolase family 43 protein [Asticcacaulis solisilvae]|uniref:glycoside hydrolase family 43 protein n=1 Tax=Asticcacaulis solisilvae TaxID=1217274 RepID=UPI003FD777AB
MRHQLAKVKNPVLRGFNPDPSICVANGTVYVATSTFEWFPGVQIHASRDLRAWELAARPLNEARLLDMRGVPDSCGVWAPCLSYSDGRFWLCYTRVSRFDGNFKDTPNYLTWAHDIAGPWSDPVFLNASGFDPSLFHDDDGRKWFLNMVWDHRDGHDRFGGIVLQEYDPGLQRLVGRPTTIYRGSGCGGTEGPHLYKRDGWYYLFVAEGGTGYGHAVTVARSRTIGGPYETDPAGFLLTARGAPGHPLQRVGHGSLAELPDGRLFLAFLCSRKGQSPMGRETGLQEIVYRDGWFRTPSGSVLPDETVFEGERAAAESRIHYRFTPGPLAEDFQWLRSPEPGRLFTLAARPGYLRLFGRQSIGALFEQALVARRQTEPVFSAEVVMDYAPDDFQQMAGLVAYYNSRKFHYLYVSHDDVLGRYAGVMVCRADETQAVEFLGERVRLPQGEIRLHLVCDGNRQQFFVAAGTGPWKAVGPALEAATLSDDAGRDVDASFTGTFVGVCAQDLTGRKVPADFRDFVYSEKP